MYKKNHSSAYYTFKKQVKDTGRLGGDDFPADLFEKIFPWEEKG